jgi:hypothetical protein
MVRAFFGRNGPGRPGARRRRRLTGCLLWLIGLIVLLLILSALFGGFQKGTRAAGAGRAESAGTMFSRID